MSKRNVFILILFIFTFLWPILSTNFKIEYDRLSQINRCFEDRQIPCRWIPESVFGYGSSLFNYLPPLPYYVGQIFFILTKVLNLSTIIIYIVPFLVSINLFIVFKKFLKKINISNMLLLALSISLLITSHNLLSIVFLFSFCLIIINSYLKDTDNKIVTYSLYSITLGILLSAFYLLPFLFERNLVKSIDINGKFVDFLPIYSQESPKEKSEEKLQILTGESEILDFKQASNNFSFKTKTKTHTIIRISQFYFPNWKIMVDGQEVNIEYKNNSLGLMTIILGEGEHTIAGRLFDTPIRTISNAITLITTFLILTLFLYQKDLVRKWLAYYKKGIGH